MTNADYYALDRWSYSSMKKILDHGIDYAVGAKTKDFEEKFGQAVNLGQLAHNFITGGEDVFAVSPFDSFRTKAARDWRDQQEELGKYVINAQQYNDIVPIVENVEKHPYFEYYLGKELKHEQEFLNATIFGVPVKGKADAFRVVKEDGKVVRVEINDLKTTAQFDDFARKAYYNHYDLQAALYSLMAVSAKDFPELNKKYEEAPEEIIKYAQFNFFVVETVAPFRVKVWTCDANFIEGGMKKLDNCLGEILRFEKREDKKPVYLDTEIGHLGDLSL